MGARVLLAWVVLTVGAVLAVYARFALRIDEATPVAVVQSVWAGGEQLEQVVTPSTASADARLEAALAGHPGATRVCETIVAEGPVVRWPETALALSFVSGRDGVSATLDGRTVYVTPDELLAHQAYDRGMVLASLQISVGLDVPVAVARLAERLHATPHEVLDRATLRRIRVVRSDAGAQRIPPVTAATLGDADLRDGALAAARYLARGVDHDGRFRYLVDAPSNRTLPGYDWPRHAGATYFLAQAAALGGAQPDVAFAALRAGALLRDHAMVRCGEHRCIGDDAVVDVGSTALGLLAFVEIARTQLDPGYALLIPELAAFLRAQQRPDGDLMHLYDRTARAPIDVQYLYYTGEAALALARSHALLGDPRDLEAASRALERLVHGGWSFFGSKYYWGEEHWTCQAMGDLWGRAPAPLEEDALDFCLGWAGYGRRLMYGPGETAFDADGAYGFGPYVTPRLTPAGSRSEAGVATLAAAERAGRPGSATTPLAAQLRRTFAMLLRHQFRPGPTHLFAEPQAVEGAIPGSEVDWALRIDYAQHAGSAMIAMLRHDQAP